MSEMPFIANAFGYLYSYGTEKRHVRRYEWLILPMFYCELHNKILIYNAPDSVDSEAHKVCK